jgi:hypothetical protein
MTTMMMMMMMMGLLEAPRLIRFVIFVLHQSLLLPTLRPPIFAVSDEALYSSTAPILDPILFGLVELDSIELS